MIKKEYLTSEDNTPLINVNLVIETPKSIINRNRKFFKEKLVYDVNLNKNHIEICKGIRTSLCSINFDIDKYSNNLKCTYNDIKNISVKKKISKFYSVLFFIGLILSFYSAASLLLCFLSLYLGYYKYLEIELNSGEIFKIYFRNNNLKDINILKYFICKHGNVTFEKHKRITGMSKDFCFIIPAVTMIGLSLNILLKIILSNEFTIENIILGNLF